MKRRSFISGLIALSFAPLTKLFPQPQPKPELTGQEIMMRSYGGARGGGKSYELQRRLNILHALRNEAMIYQYYRDDQYISYDELMRSTPEPESKRSS